MLKVLKVPKGFRGNLGPKALREHKVVVVLKDLAELKELKVLKVLKDFLEF